MPTLLHIVAIVLIFVTYYILYKWRNPKCRGKLLPGSSGFPLIGETLELFIPSYSFDIQPFIKKRLQRYGLLFRTNIAGRHTVISADPEFNRFIFQQEGKLVVRQYLDSFEGVFKAGEFNGFTIHKYIRKMTLNQFGVDSIREKLISKFEQEVRSSLKSWCIQDSVEFKSASVAMYASFGAKQLYNCDPEKMEELRNKYLEFSNSLMSFPLNIPGTLYHKCLKNKEIALKIVNDTVEARLNTSSPVENLQHDDMLDKMIKDMNDNKSITKDVIPHILFGISMAVFEAIPAVLTFALKFISENPAILRELIAEHEQILERRQIMNSPVTWAEYKSMTFTHQVVHESLRLGNVIPGVLRKTVKDIHIKGYMIPAGWQIMVCTSVHHLDPIIYKDPLEFNPWRWKDVEQEFIRENLKPFGGGMKHCAGADYARVTMAVFLHVFVTKYRWTIIKGGDVVKNPILYFKNGLHISVSERSKFKHTI